MPFRLYKTGSYMPSSLFFHSPSDYSCTNGFLHDPGSPILIALAPAHLDILESLRNRVTSLRPPSATGDQSWLWRPERRSTPVPRVQVAKQGCGEYFAPTSPQAANQNMFTITSSIGCGDTVDARLASGMRLTHVRRGLLCTVLLIHARGALVQRRAGIG